MKNITLYIASTVLYTSIIVIFSLTTIFFLFTYIAQTGDIGKGNFNAFEAFLYVLCEIPANIYIIMPVCALLGSLMGLGLLSSNSELIAMRASGHSTIDISKGILLVAGGLALITFLTGAYVAPYFQKKATINKIVAKKGSAETLILHNTDNLWIYRNDSFIHIDRSNTKNKVLEEITRYTIKNNQLKFVHDANDAVFDNEEWRLKDITNMRVTSYSSTDHYSKYQYWKCLLPPFLLKVISSNTNFLNLSELIKYIKITKEGSKNIDRIWLKFWRIFFQPISLIILMLIAVPFSLGSVRSSSLGYRFAIGTIFGFSFYIINQTFGPFSLLYNISGFWGAAAPSFLFFFILSVLFLVVRE